MNLKKIVFTVIFIVLMVIVMRYIDSLPVKEKHMDREEKEEISVLYDNLDNKKNLSEDVFVHAYYGFKRLKYERKNIICIIDFSLPSTEKRFFVIDLENMKIVHNTYVAHGEKTGDLNAEFFSNKENSHKSSLGFYRTAETYNGKHGLSLKLDGLEEGLNSNARKRYIVIHSAQYVSEEFIKENGRLGLSWGCPAIPVEKSNEIIQLIKNDCCLFIYGNKDEYIKKSSLFY